MNAAVLHALGTAPRFEQFVEPTAGEGEVIVHVRAAALKPVEKQIAAGKHYVRPQDLPVVCGLDGVGHLEDGSRVFFGGPRRPFGAMAERTVVHRALCFPLPEAVDDATAAALPNPGVSAWLSLRHRAKLVPGETVLVLGATGVTGRLAVQIARLLGAAKVVAAGRNEQALTALKSVGADATIQLETRDAELQQAFAREIGDAGIQVIIDYLWGHPTEVLLGALTRSEFASAKSETRLVQAGESAGHTIALPAAVLRSTAFTILGTGGMAPREVLGDALREVLDRGAKGELRIETEKVPLAQIQEAWQRENLAGRRLVIIP